MLIVIDTKIVFQLELFSILLCVVFLLYLSLGLVGILIGPMASSAALDDVALVSGQQHMGISHLD